MSLLIYLLALCVAIAILRTAFIVLRLMILILLSAAIAFVGTMVLTSALLTRSLHCAWAAREALRSRTSPPSSQASNVVRFRRRA
jgi:membrane protein implicated in regulation of membrane protease activity